MTALTVVLPVHNAMPYLPAALDSILHQSLQDVTVLAIDDGSTDASGCYLDSVDDPRLSVVHQSQQGLGATLNLALELCRTEFVARMDADDLSRSLRLEQQLALLQSDRDLVAVGSPLDFLVGDDLQTGLAYPREHTVIVQALLEHGSGLSHPTLLMRTATARSVGYRISGAGEDLDFCLRLAERGHVTNLATAQYLYRLHATSISMTQQDALERGYTYARITARERAHGHPETSFNDFQAQWNRRNPVQRLQSRAVSVSLMRYRRARIAWARRKRLEGAACLAISAMLQPSRALKTLATRVRSSAPHTGLEV